TVAKHADDYTQLVQVYRLQLIAFGVFTITSHYAHRRNALNAILPQTPQKEMLYPVKTRKMRQDRFQLAA
ncbi:hypothetical protein AB9A82_25385, partial [Escherichia coli]